MPTTAQVVETVAWGGNPLLRRLRLSGQGAAGAAQGDFAEGLGVHQQACLSETPFCVRQQADIHRKSGVRSKVEPCP
jgi:hypothetical protein